MRDRPSFPFATIVEALFAHADQRPNGLAYVIDGGRITYGELRDDALTLAAALNARGVGPGDRCALVLGTAIDTVRAIYAVQIVGAAPVIIDPSQTTAKLHRRIQTVRPKLVIHGEEAPAESGDIPVAAIADIRGEGRRGWQPAVLPAPTDTAYLQVTSGTSGEPKAAIMSHKSLVAGLLSRAARLELRPDDIFMSWVPLHHNMGLVRFTFLPCFTGCPAYLVPPAVSNIEQWLRLAGEVSATITGGPDFGYRIASKLVDAGLVDLSALRFATNGAEPVRASTIRDFEKRFACPGVIRPGYGLVESAAGISTNRPGQELRVDASGCVSCGPPVEGMDIVILDKDGGRCGPGEVGEIVARGEAVFDGYLDDPETTAEMLRDGWLHTGDIGYLSDDGELYVLGRRRVLLKRAGATVLPREIEEAVDLVEGVRLSAVIGHVRDLGSGDEDIVVVAEIEPEAAAGDDAPSRLTKDIESAMQASVGFRPSDVVLVRPLTIPRTLSGKVKHVELKGIYAEGRLDDDGAVLFSTRQ